MTTITITTDDHTAYQILDALKEAEEFGQVTGPFDVQTRREGEITEIEPTVSHVVRATIAPQGWRDQPLT